MSIDSYRGWRTHFAELTAIAEETGIAERRPALLTSMRRAANPSGATLRLARALLADELDRRWIMDLPEEARQAQLDQGVDRLDIAYDLATSTLDERPSSWEALLVIGGSEYLRMSRRRNHRVEQDRELWQTPLEASHRLAPTQPEPLRLLAATDLGRWSFLGPEEREQSIARLRLAFEDATTFGLLLPVWMRVAPSLSLALDVVPDQASAWSEMMEYFRSRGDWDRYRDVRARRQVASRAFSQERLDDGVDRLRGGDRRKGIQRLAWVGRNLSPDRANVPLIEGLMAVAPPDIASDSSLPWLRAWRSWALDHCLSQTGCPISGEALLRLVSLDREVPDHDRAYAQALAGSLREAESLERNSADLPGGLLTADWTRYAITVARVLSERGEHTEALLMLDRVPGNATDDARFQEATVQIAKAAQDPVWTEGAERWLSARRREAWAPSDWSVDRYRAQLEVLPTTSATGLRLELAGQPEATGLITVHWDGAEVAAEPSGDGRVIEVAVPIDATRHLLELTWEAGAKPTRAEVTLLPRQP